MYKNIHLVPINLANVFLYSPNLNVTTVRDMLSLNLQGDGGLAICSATLPALCLCFFPTVYLHHTGLTKRVWGVEVEEEAKGMGR